MVGDPCIDTRVDIHRRAEELRELPQMVITMEGDGIFREQWRYIYNNPVATLLI